jgi:hypothetical protein
MIALDDPAQALVHLSPGGLRFFHAVEDGERKNEGK